MKRKLVTLVCFVTIVCLCILVLPSLAQPSIPQPSFAQPSSGATIRVSQSKDDLKGIKRETTAVYNSVTKLLEVKGYLLPMDPNAIPTFPDGTLHPAVPDTRFNDNISTPIGRITSVGKQEISFTVVDSTVTNVKDVRTSTIYAMEQDYSNLDGGFKVSIPANLAAGNYILWISTLDADVMSIAFTVS